MKKTIVILSHVTFDNSPYCSYVHNHAKALKKEGYNVIVFALLNWFPLLSLFKKNRREHYKTLKGTKYVDGIQIVYKKRLSFSNLLYRSKINLNGISYYYAIKGLFSKFMKKHNIVLIDAHTFKVEGYVAYQLHKKYNIPTFLTCHGSSFDYNIHFNNGIYQIIKYCKSINKVICVSNKIQNQLAKLGIYNTEVVYNGINFYDNLKESKKEEHMIITVSSLTHDKNIDKIIQAFSVIKNKYKDASLVIVGDGPLKNDLHVQVKELKVEDSVIFTGQIANKEVYEYLSKANIFVLPSSPEGFGISYVEAMYNKCIAIGTKNEGIDGFIIDKKNGFLININSEEIVNIVSQIFDKSIDVEAIRLNGYNSSKKLTWSNNAKKYIKLLCGGLND